LPGFVALPNLRQSAALTPQFSTSTHSKVRQTTWLWFCPFHHALAATFYPRDLGSSLSLLGLQGRACLVSIASAIPQNSRCCRHCHLPS